MDAPRKSQPRTTAARMRTAVLTAPGRFSLEEEARRPEGFLEALVRI
jgi:hypothetical protein